MNPGSHCAQQRGCLCPPVENQYGLGLPGGSLFGAPQFAVAPRCRLHGEGSGWRYVPLSPVETPEPRVVLGVFKAERLREVIR